MTDGSCVSLIGAGGKTAAMLAAAGDLAALGLRVLITTTTRIWPPAGFPAVLVEGCPDLARELAARFDRSPAVVLGRTVGADGKLYGVPGEMVCSLLAQGVANVVLCEADGAAGRSLKAHDAHEPVVPACSTHLVVVAGVGAVGKLLDDRVVHRPALLAALLGVPPGTALRPDHVVAGLLACARFAPPLSRRIYLLNQVDDEGRWADASSIAARLKDQDPDALALPARRGVPLAPASAGTAAGRSPRP
ncbi:MAG: putative selenium-dependent hydroxylase accessory protein YqeC [Chloroflexi bacterium]|nr:putative selenium-dependent hydroxylase accessory protein YqeC [Chloroflexota bacterium]